MSLPWSAGNWAGYLWQAQDSGVGREQILATTCQEPNARILARNPETAPLYSEIYCDRLAYRAAEDYCIDPKTKFMTLSASL